ncbi:divergent polysaccharide deacetylase family protein [Terasakiella sp. A23]|uniref:divergent polysaccharide deacetylase family protein n=1 Tax=Terasakiella sp. FCG-A23 TaxID=3080561 RepID=UPI002954797B|nr:divergent polysaccharide deacetylase family protein [Terasakiella sp. A23]MDV7338161.1 divergent polysaccharide deacetylase family protein [Terasakiella sp. A23]
MADDDDDFDLDFDDDDEVSGESGVPAPTDYDDDDDDFDFDDFDDDFDGEGKGSKLKEMLAGKGKLIGIIVGAVVGLGAIGGGAYWYFMGDDGSAEMAEGSKGKPIGGVGGAVGMALQQQATSGLTPQTGKLTQGGKLMQGGATGGGKLTAAGSAPAKLTAGGSKLTAASAATVAATTSGGMGGYNPDNPANPLSTAAVAEVGVNIPAVLPRAFNGLGQPKAPQPLATPDDKSLFEVTDVGLLPMVSQDGREPWKTYARPFAGDPSTPVVGLVVTGLGQSATLTEAAINYLPPDVTLSFSAYGRGVKDWVLKARAMGHEVLLELPMETDSFPVDDPGPMAMMTSKSPTENLKLLNLLMMQAQGYVGFVGQHGSRFTKNKKAMAPVLGEIKTRGLFFMDPRTAEGSLTLEMADQMQLARAIADTTISPNVSGQRLRAQLDTIATIAGNQGATTALVTATPNSIRVIKEWTEKLQNVKIAPITSLAGRQRS